MGACISKRIPPSCQRRLFDLIINLSQIGTGTMLLVHSCDAKTWIFDGKTTIWSLWSDAFLGELSGL
jgi:hypothetical protein